MFTKVESKERKVQTEKKTMQENGKNTQEI